MKRRVTWVVACLLGVLFVAGVAGCGQSGGAAVAVELAPASALPDFAKSAPPETQEAYRFAIANQEYLANFPCYCGCSSVGHKSNLQCYIKQANSDGSLVFDEHALA